MNRIIFLPLLFFGCAPEGYLNKKHTCEVVETKDQTKTIRSYQASLKVRGEKIERLEKLLEVYKESNEYGAFFREAVRESLTGEQYNKIQDRADELASEYEGE